ncbi:hypothetical protein D3C76_1516980 [compost metagenome]
MLRLTLQIAYPEFDAIHPLDGDGASGFFLQQVVIQLAGAWIVVLLEVKAAIEQ